MASITSTSRLPVTKVHQAWFHSSSTQPLEVGDKLLMVQPKGDDYYDPRKPDQRPQKVVSSAYIIYPGTYLEHDPDEAEIGALPLIPYMTQDDLLEVEEAIKDIL